MAKKKAAKSEKKAARKAKKKDILGRIDLPDELVDKGREIWLAGLGALASVQEDGAQAFHALVQKGKEWENAGRKKLGKAAKKLDKADDFDDRVQAAIERGAQRLGLSTRTDVQALAQTVEALSAQVAALTGTAGSEETAAADQIVYHIVPQDEGWVVEQEGNEGPRSKHVTKKAAVAAGRALAKGQTPSRLVVHRQDGTVQDAFSYGTQ